VGGQPRSIERQRVHGKEGAIYLPLLDVQQLAEALDVIDQVPGCVLSQLRVRLGAAAACVKRLCFGRFPYVCPEPVLVKQSFLV
jgi:hypothetical protein